MPPGNKRMRHFHGLGTGVRHATAKETYMDAVDTRSLQALVEQFRREEQQQGYFAEPASGHGEAGGSGDGTGSGGDEGMAAAGASG